MAIRSVATAAWSVTKAGGCTSLALGAVLAVSLAGPLHAEEITQHDDLDATLWMRTSVEYKANCVAAYDLAKIRLDEALADKSWTAATEQKNSYKDLPPAVIVDADETVLDNSAYEAWTVVHNTHYSGKTWDAFVKDEVSSSVPGALDFAKYAASKGVKVFYVTNRSEGQKDATKANLEKLGFPMGGNVDTVLTKDKAKGWGSNKGTRRAFIAKDYRILLLLGDNLGDFTDSFRGSPEDRLPVYEKAAAHWGHDWIVIANPTYGSWEQAPFKGNYSLSPAERRQMQIDALKPWQGMN